MGSDARLCDLFGGTARDRSDREWQELHGLRVVPPLAPFIEDEADEADDGGADEAVERCPDAFGLGAMEGAGAK